MNMEEEEKEFNQIICVAARAIECYYLKYIHKDPCMNSVQTGNMWLMEILQGNRKRCYRMLRMEKHVFNRLCSDLEVNYGLKGSRRMCAADILGMFLHILGHGIGNRLAQERFQHSGETVSRYFGYMLNIICLLAADVVKPEDPTFKGVPKEILGDSRYMPHFKDCIGAIDGVHVPASIPPEEQVPYIGRKGIPTQNVMAVCNFNMEFTFVCAGWEGTAHDARVFQTTLRNPAMKFPNPPKGKYYLVDAGYPQMSGYLGPYKGERYHLPDFCRGNQPMGQKEVFNHMHSSLRSVIERNFGVWKKRWKILRDMPSYPFEKQVKIVVATMTLHNYIRKHTQSDTHFKDINDDPDDNINEGAEGESSTQDDYHVADGPGSKEMETVRNKIAASLMQG